MKSVWLQFAKNSYTEEESKEKLNEIAKLLSGKINDDVDAPKHPASFAPSASKDKDVDSYEYLITTSIDFSQAVVILQDLKNRKQLENVGFQLR